MYRTFFRLKKNGKKRKIEAPCPELKAMQASLAKVLQDRVLSDSAHGFVVGRSPLTNAMNHLSQRYVLNIDVKDFFPSIKQRRFIQLVGDRFDPPLLEWISYICFWKGALPQGAPTSPVLSNIYLSKVDERMEALAQKKGLRYSRYADDLTFSGNDSLKADMAVVLKEVDQTLRSLCLIRNEKKTKLMPYYQRQVVTGIVVNGDKTTLSGKIKQEWLKLMKEKSCESLSATELGYLGYIKSVDLAFYEKLTGGWHAGA